MATLRRATARERPGLGSRYPYKPSATEQKEGFCLKFVLPCAAPVPFPPVLRKCSPPHCKASRLALLRSLGESTRAWGHDKQSSAPSQILTGQVNAPGTPKPARIILKLQTAAAV